MKKLRLWEVKLPKTAYSVSGWALLVPEPLLLLLFQ
jgi:hypothetical protein